MKDLLILTRESLPRWYGLFWNPNPPALILLVHRELPAAGLHERPDLIESTMTDFGFSSFRSLFEEDGVVEFGFNGTLTSDGMVGDFKRFVAELPVVRKETDRPCSYCVGSGKDRFLDGKCLTCDGSGKEVIFDHTQSFALAASLGLFFSAAYFPKERTSAVRPQLFSVISTVQSGGRGQGINGMYGIEFCDWLRRQSDDRELPVMTGAMRVARRHMVGGDTLSDNRFRAEVAGPDGWLNVSCPGEGCGLNPSYHRGPKPGKGYEFSSHNVDSPHQLLTLLAGLAALHNLVDDAL